MAPTAQVSYKRVLSLRATVNERPAPYWAATRTSTTIISMNSRNLSGGTSGHSGTMGPVSGSSVLAAAPSVSLELLEGEGPRRPSCGAPPECCGEEACKGAGHCELQLRNYLTPGRVPRCAGEP